MKKRILDFIVCPECNSDFELVTFLEDKGRIKEGLLTCSVCAKTYPIIDFIPRIIKGIMNDYLDFAKKYNLPLPKNDTYFGKVSILEALNTKTRKSFGYQWTRKVFSQIIPKFEEDFLNYIYPVQRDFFCHKIGIDIGCGFGRHIYYAAGFGAEMIGIDFSRAIDSAYNNTKELEDIHLIQADIYNLPLRRNYFDFAYSIGVLHHLPDPEKGFSSILELIRSGGYVSIWLYSKSRPAVNFTIESIRFITKRIPHVFLYSICLILSGLEWLFIILPYKILIKIPFIGSFLEKNIFRRVKIYSGYPFAVFPADWFDRLSVPIRHYYNKLDIEGWFKRPDLQLLTILPTDSYGWRAFAKKL